MASRCNNRPSSAQAPACHEVSLANELVVHPKRGVGVEETKVSWPDHGMRDANQAVAANAAARMQMAYCGWRGAVATAAVAAAVAAAAAAAEPRLVPGYETGSQTDKHLLFLWSGQSRTSAAMAPEEQTKA